MTDQNVLPVGNIPPRHTAERELLLWAVEGDQRAAVQVIIYLSSANPYLRQVMLDTLHENTEARVWHRLLFCAARHCWDSEAPSERLEQLDTARQFDESLLAAFTEDRSEAERRFKLDVLEKAQEDTDTAVGQAAAYFLGMRRDPRAIPVLAKTILHSETAAQVRAIHALTAIGDARCAPPLIDALAADRDILHREAGWALGKLGEAARPVLTQALDHPDEHVRWHAARALAEIANPNRPADKNHPSERRAADLLAQGLQNTHVAIRRASIQALARLDTIAVPAILALLGQAHLDENTYQSAYQALHAMQAPATRRRLLPMLDALHKITTRDRAAAVARQLLADWPAET